MRGTMFSLLPTSLLALLSSSPARAAPTTPNDLFRDIAVHAPKQPEEPVCCLRPLTPLESSDEEDIFLSFEDWKAKRLSEVKEDSMQANPHKAPENLSESTLVSDASQPSGQAQGSVSVDVQENGGTPERLAPHFRIPLTDRFNYASLDCSARVHGAHKSAKSAASILSSKKDRYMLSPCAEETQFVIVELCEDIRMDTVQLANYEFFSGVFKDFSVSVAKKYTDDGDWTPAGTFRARNVRGVQSFHTPPTLRDFYRYIRIDFHSHYGNEYYCPLSLLRVYGLTQLEEWQWETWEAESRAKRLVEEASPPVEVVADPPEPAYSLDSHVFESEDSGAQIPVTVPSSSTAGSSGASTNSIPVTSELLKSLQYTLSTPPSTPESLPTSEGVTSCSKTRNEDHSHSHDPARHDTLYNTPVSLSSSPLHAHSTAPDNHSSSASIFIDQSESRSHSPSHSHASSSLRASSATPNVSALSTISPSYVAPPMSTGGESIYRTIMNRLAALEGNTTLYARYVEEQTAGMREVLRRLTEDIGRLEGIGKAQAQLYQRSVVELEKQTRRLEDEQRELLSRVNLLTDEVVLEKRLGIAQLCLLLTVLVFMALTRGSRGEYVHAPGASRSVRDWGRRTLSFSGELVNRLRTRSSTPPRTGGQKPGENEIIFPSVDSQISDDQRRTRRAHTAGNLNSNPNTRKMAVRPHTPTSIRTPTSRHFVHHRAAVPLSPSYNHHAFGPRPAIQRSNSGGMGGLLGPVPKSAKRWARSAHLHEVKVGNGSGNEKENMASSSRRQGVDGRVTPVPVSGPSFPAGLNFNVRDVFDADAGYGYYDDDGDDGQAGAQVLVLPSAISRSETVTLGKGKGRMHGAVPGSVRQPSPLRPAAVIDLSSPPAQRRTLFPREEDASEGDPWVDTDVDGSECDSVGDSGAEGVRERTYVVSATNSSL